MDLAGPLLFVLNLGVLDTSVSPEGGPGVSHTPEWALLGIRRSPAWRLTLLSPEGGRGNSFR